MPTLATCIDGAFTVAASAGEPPVVPVLGSFLDPDDYNPDAVENSLDYTKFYNSGYLLLLMV